MSDLTTKQKKKLPASDYGLPEEKKYPMPDKAHAANAKARASAEYNKGNLAASQKAEIDRKANKILDKKKK